MLIPEFPKLTPAPKGKKIDETNVSIFSEYLLVYVNICIILDRVGLLQSPLIKFGRSYRHIFVLFSPASLFFSAGCILYSF